MLITSSGYKLESISIQNKCNLSYISDLLDLYNEYKDFLIDDYYPDDLRGQYDLILETIQLCDPWFLVVKDIQDNFVGVMWLRLWHGSGSKTHSCQLQAYAKKEYWGKAVREILHVIENYLFNDLDLQRVQMEIPEFNRPARYFASSNGYKKEGIIRNATIKDLKAINHILYSKLKEDFING